MKVLVPQTIFVDNYIFSVDTLKNTWHVLVPCKVLCICFSLQMVQSNQVSPARNFRLSKILQAALERGAMGRRSERRRCGRTALWISWEAMMSSPPQRECETDTELTAPTTSTLVIFPPDCNHQPTINTRERLGKAKGRITTENRCYWLSDRIGKELILIIISV